MTAVINLCATGILGASKLSSLPSPISGEAICHGPTREVVDPFN